MNKEDKRYLKKWCTCPTSFCERAGWDCNNCQCKKDALRMPYEIRKNGRLAIAFWKK